MISRVDSLGLNGIEGYTVSVECYISGGLAEALLTDDGIEWDFVEGTDDLDNGGGHGKQCGALEEVLLFLSVRHRQPPYLDSSKSLGMA